MTYPKLKFPDWESVKKISKDLRTTVSIFYFDTLNVYGELTFFEEEYDSKSDYMIYFDVFEGGYSGKNIYQERLRKNLQASPSLV